jgi:hypothetical protein
MIKNLKAKGCLMVKNPKGSDCPFDLGRDDNTSCILAYSEDLDRRTFHDG